MAPIPWPVLGSALSALGTALLVAYLRRYRGKPGANWFFPPRAMGSPGSLRAGVAGPDAGPLPGRYRQRSTKFRRIRRPVSPDFSGWNWVPKTFPRSLATTEAKSVPCSEVATTASGSSGTA